MRGVVRRATRVSGRHWQRLLLAHPNADFALLILGSTFLMGSSFVAGKILLARGVPPMLLVGWRFLIAALFALPFAYLQGGRKWTSLLPLHARDAAWTAAIGVVQTAAVMGLLFLAMKTIWAATAAILLFTNPLWVAMLGRPVTLTQCCGGLLVGVSLWLLNRGPAKPRARAAR